jgi:hypothetical protein
MCSDSIRNHWYDRNFGKASSECSLYNNLQERSPNSFKKKKKKTFRTRCRVKTLISHGDLCYQMSFLTHIPHSSVSSSISDLTSMSFGFMDPWHPPQNARSPVKRLAVRPFELKVVPTRCIFSCLAWHSLAAFSFLSSPPFRWFMWPVLRFTPVLLWKLTTGQTVSDQNCEGRCTPLFLEVMNSVFTNIVSSYSDGGAFWLNTDSTPVQALSHRHTLF